MERSQKVHGEAMTGDELNLPYSHNISFTREKLLLKPLFSLLSAATVYREEEKREKNVTK